MVVRYTIGTASAISFNKSESRNWLRSYERFNYIEWLMLTLNLNIFFYLNVFTHFQDVNSSVPRETAY